MLLDYCFASICMISSWILYRSSHSQLAGRAYLLRNQVTHSRFLPTASKHSFVYPTLSLFVSLNALEGGQLDLLGGWLFGYGGTRGRITGLRPSGYLYNSPADNRTIRQKLIAVIDQHGYPGHEFHDAWLMTMPSFLGVEGINPLSVYFCYRKGNSSMWLVVLEVHNTFGERNIYLLQTSESEQVCSGRFHHEWIFPRQFHVSPFNDRSGYYICQLTAPPRAPSALEDRSFPSPRPIVKVTLLTAPPHAEKKLVAILRTTHTTPLSGKSLLVALACTPLNLLLSFPRIVYQAYILHYHKRLNVYQRPEPLASDPTVEAHLPPVPNAIQKDTKQVTSSVGWQPKSFIERWCQNRVDAFLRKRCTETGISVAFIAANPFEERRTTFLSETDGTTLNSQLTIYYRSPRMFTILFMMPSPMHALLFGVQAERVFSVSSEELFTALFAPSSLESRRQSASTRLARHIRSKMVPDSLNLPIPPSQPLDDPLILTSIFVLCILWAFATLEEKLFKTIGARFVPGDEPWGGWTRLNSGGLYRPWGKLGSVRREENL